MKRQIWFNGIPVFLILYTILCITCKVNSQDINYKDVKLLDDDIHLLISEVADPADNYQARFVEIYNLGADTVDFSIDTVFLSRQANGSTWADVQLAGSVGPGAAFIIANNSANFSAAFGFDPDQASGVITGNGDDGYFLYKGGDHDNGNLLDAFGVIDQDGTGEPWEYLDSRATRHYDITMPNTSWSSTEWSIPTGANVNEMTPKVHKDSATWNGSISEDWHTNANWDLISSYNYIPDASCITTVPDNALNFPTISSDAFCHEIILRSSANNNASLLGNENLTIINHAKVESYLTGGTLTFTEDPPDAIYHFVASPVSSVEAISVFPGTSYLREWNEVIQVWENLAGNDQLIPGKGYSLYLAGGTTLVTYQGTLNSVDVSPQVTYTTGGTPDPALDGYNLVGNPFPSGIDWDEGSWTKNSIDASIAIWDGNSGNYIYWNGTVGDITNGIIPPAQGFFVKASDAGALLTIPVDAGVHSNSVFYKQEEFVEKLLTLKVTSSSDSLFDKSYINFREASTPGYDGQFDSRKLWGLEMAPQLYTLTNSGDMLSINTLPSISGNEEIPLCFKTGYNGTFILKVKGMDSFDPSTPLWLEDVRDDIFTNLRNEDPYVFYYEATDDPLRFKIHFSEPALVEPETKGSAVAIFPGNNGIIIRNNGLKGMVMVYNLSGQLITCAPVTNSYTCIDINSCEEIYLVRFVSQGFTVTSKIYVK